MEYNLKTALIVISAVVITAIFVHGFWTIRKNKNPYKLKAKSNNENVETPHRGFDGSGFDQDGVSKPRVVENPLNDEVSHQEIPMPATSDYEEQASSYREFNAEDNEPSLGDMSSLDNMTNNKENNVPDLRAQEESLFEQVKAEEARTARALCPPGMKCARPARAAAAPAPTAHAAGACRAGRLAARRPRRAGAAPCRPPGRARWPPRADSARRCAC